MKPRVYILHTNGKLVRQAIESVREHFDVVVFYNRHPYPSPLDLENRADEWAMLSGVARIHTPVEMSYSQLRNWAQSLESAMRGLDRPVFYFTMHDDCYVTDPSKLPDLVKWIENATAGLKWWCVYTEYDSLCAWSTAAATDLGPMDQTLPLYFCDLDNYARFTAAGYTNFQSPFAHIVHHEKNQTYKSDPRREFLNGITFPLYKSYFDQKWGGHPATFTKPFNGAISND